MKSTTYEFAVNFFSRCSNHMLKKIIEDIKKTQFEENSVIIEAVLEIYGKVDIIHIQIMGLMPALLSVISERLKD